MPRQGANLVTNKNGIGRGKECERQRKFAGCLICISRESKILKSHKPGYRNISILKSAQLSTKKGNIINRIWVMDSEEELQSRKKHSPDNI